MVLGVWLAIKPSSVLPRIATTSCGDPSHNQCWRGFKSVILHSAECGDREGRKQRFGVCVTALPLSTLVDVPQKATRMSAMEALLVIVRRELDAGHVSVAELADACDVSREYIYKLLRGDSQPTVPKAEKLAAAVGAEITVKTRSRRKITA